MTKSKARKDAAAETTEQPEATEAEQAKAEVQSETAEPKPTKDEAPPETTAEALAREAGHDVELKKTRRDIALKLTDHQTAAAAKEAADLSYERANLEAEFGRVKSSYKGRIDDLDKQIVEALTLVRDGSESKTVDVIDRYDYTDGVVRTYWASELVETRPLTADERQMGLKFINAKKTAEEKAAADEQPSNVVELPRATPEAAQEAPASV
jgi:hypothetical protein